MDNDIRNLSLWRSFWAGTAEDLITPEICYSIQDNCYLKKKKIIKVSRTVFDWPKSLIPVTQ